MDKLWNGKLKLYFWDVQPRGGWNELLSSMSHLWKRGMPTAMITRMDEDHYFEKVYWFQL